MAAGCSCPVSVDSGPVEQTYKHNRREQAKEGSPCNEPRAPQSECTSTTTAVQLQSPVHFHYRSGKLYNKECRSRGLDTCNQRTETRPEAGELLRVQSTDSVSSGTNSPLPSLTPKHTPATPEENPANQIQEADGRPPPHHLSQEG